MLLQKEKIILWLSNIPLYIYTQTTISYSIRQL